jgi:endonuclease YncB( thermonuclease family)
MELLSHMPSLSSLVGSKLADILWRTRSWKGKTLVIVAGTFMALLAIGIAFPAENAPDADPASANADTPRGETTTQTETVGTSQDETTTEAAPPAPPPPPLRVSRVVDGDTIDLDNGVTVRLVQIDAPEREGECYGRKAGAELRRLLPAGTKVRLVRDPSLDNTDRYGRLLRYVFEARQNINVTLLRRGAASVWFFDGDRGRYAAKFARTADQARAKERGAWGVCEASTNYLASWKTKVRPQPKPVAQPTSNCHPSYKGACLDPSAYDYDCAGGSGDGPAYTGFVRVVGDDEYGLDADDDGYGCE